MMQNDEYYAFTQLHNHCQDQGVEHYHHLRKSFMSVHSLKAPGFGDISLNPFRLFSILQ
jgi:hypothetical protein